MDLPREDESMRLRFTPILLAALIAFGVASTPAQSQSQDAGWFLGASGGIAKVRDGCPGVTVPGSTCDDSDTAWRVFGGYQFNSYFGYELGYADLGEVTQSVAGVGSATFETKAVDMALVLTLPIDPQLALYGKWGIFYWELDRTITGVGAGTTEATGTDITYGFGIKYSLTRNFALRMEWQRYRDVGDAATTGTSNVDVASLGIAFKF